MTEPSPLPNHARRASVPLPVLQHLAHAPSRAPAHPDPPDPDEPREKCGVFACWGNQHPAESAFFALYALQHRGQESAGIATTDGRTIERRAAMGLVPNALTPADIEALNAHAQDRTAGDPPGQGVGGAIAHNRYSTTGDSTHINAQPFVGHLRDGPVAIAHNGNLINALEIREALQSAGHAFHTTSDTEVILQLIAHTSREQSDGEDPVAGSLARLRGAFSLVLLFHDRIVAARDPWGWRPLVLGELPCGAPVVASESVAFGVLGAKYIREIEPGELVTLSDHGVESTRYAPPAEPLAHCVFEHVYFASPASQVFGSTVQIVRERLGERMAHEAPVAADLVMPMPDSGRSAATGFARALGLPYREGIIPNRYVGRTFIKPTTGERATAVRLKLNVVAEIVSGQRVVVVDDSIVRGTTTRLKIDQIRAAGAKEIHLRISCPPIKHPCFFGVDFPDREQLVAHQRSIEQIRQLLGVDSIAFLSLEGLLAVVHTDRVPAEHYCTACYSGDYPIEIPASHHKELLAKNC
ncbi:MAG: amidophosphoribosyltransferase [Phycisphaerales bacterium]